MLAINIKFDSFIVFVLETVVKNLKHICFNRTPLYLFAVEANAHEIILKFLDSKFEENR